jgi:hypothetical protein
LMEEVNRQMLPVDFLFADPEEKPGFWEPLIRRWNFDHSEVTILRITSSGQDSGGNGTEPTDNASQWWDNIPGWRQIVEAGTDPMLIQILTQMVWSAGAPWEPQDAQRYVDMFIRDWYDDEPLIALRGLNTVAQYMFNCMLRLTTPEQGNEAE